MIQRNSSTQITRSTTQGDLLIPFSKSTFGQQSFSVRANQNWNSLPTTIKDIHTHSPLQHTFKHGCPSTITAHINLCQRWCVCCVLMWQSLLPPLNPCYLLACSVLYMLSMWAKWLLFPCLLCIVFVAQTALMSLPSSVLVWLFLLRLCAICLCKKKSHVCVCVCVWLHTL